MDTIQKSNPATLRLQYFDETQCAGIVNNALAVLEATGCDIHHEGARRMLSAAGCEVVDKRVRIPAALVKAALKTAAKEITIFNRDGEPTLKLSARNEACYFSAGIANQHRLSVESGLKRPATKKDAAEAALVIDALPNVDVACGLSCISDCPDALADVWETRMMLENTRKPFMMWNFDRQNIDTQIELCSAAAGSREAFLSKPFVICSECASSPLAHSAEAMDKFIYLCELGLPVAYLGAPSIGGTGPMTVAGSYTVSLDDCFVGLVLSQLIRAGNPFIAACFVDVMDMQSMAFTFSAPEFNRNSAATADILRYLDVPYMVHLGCTDSPLFDQQAAFDIGVQIYSAFLVRTNLNFFLGYLESAMSSSLTALVYGDEIIDYCRHLLTPVAVDDETLAAAVIGAVGPSGNFLAEEHTIRHFRENWIPRDIVRTSREKWEAAGAKDLGARITERVRGILSRGSKHPLPGEVIAALDEIMARAENSAGQVGNE